MSVPGINTLSSCPIDPYPTTPPRGYSVSTACPDDLATIYQTVRATGQHNFVAARIPVPHGLNMAAWRQYAHCHNDPELTQFLEYGFPISYMLPPNATPSCQQSRLSHPVSLPCGPLYHNGITIWHPVWPVSRTPISPLSNQCPHDRP